MCRLAGVAIAAVATLALLPSSRAAATDPFIYDGRLEDLDSASAQSVALLFEVYSTETGGARLGEALGPFRVVPQNGRVVVDVGPLPAEAIRPGVWLQVHVDGRALPREPLELVYYDAADAQGKLTGGRKLIQSVARRGITTRSGASVTTIIDNGPPSNRVDFTCVGDGYRESQLPTYHSHAQAGMNFLFSREPFSTYRKYFNVHRVDVISPESGVDHDPTFGIFRDTALDMSFWCDGIERLLCVGITKAESYAANAPDADQIFAIANSFHYGGAGYTLANLATFAGGNSLAPELALHELGHSLGNLADEYDYGGATFYNGPEFYEPNVSIRDADAMASAGAKWAEWLGDSNTLFDGTVGTFEGAAYHEFGVFRPTQNSLMRNLVRPFNLPSIESLLAEIYRVVDPIDDFTPTAVPLFDPEFVFIKPIDPVRVPLSIEWRIDGALIPGATGDTLWIDALGLAPGTYTLSMKATDKTPWVRDPAISSTLLTQTLVWELHPTCTTTSPTIVLTEPSGPATYCSGSAASVAWQCAAVPYHYDVQFSAGLAGAWSTVASGLATGDAGAEWIVPLAATSQGRLRVLTENCAGAGADSVGSVTIDAASPLPVLSSPVAGQSHCALSPIRVAWEDGSACPATSLRIELSTDAGASWALLRSEQGAGTGVSEPLLPDVQTSTARIRLTLTNPVGSSARESGNFTIAASGPPAPEVVSPNGGEVWGVGSTHTITWDNLQCSASLHRIDYSSDHGSTWTLVHEDAGTGNGSFEWTLPGATAAARVRVSLGNAAGAITDVSDASFTILGAPAPVTLRPAGGEVWVEGTERLITWSNSGGEANRHSIDYSTDAGASWVPILQNAPGDDGRHVFMVPSTTTLAAKVRVTLSSEVGTQFAPSAGLFAIVSSADFVNGTTSALAAAGSEGVAWIDYDSDGDEDLATTSPVTGSVLFANDGYGDFADVTPTALAHFGATAHASTWADYDNDGDPDVYVAISGPDKLVRNDGGGAFTDMTTPPLDDPGDGRSAAWADYDRDGDVDLYVVNFGQPNRLLRNDAGAFIDVTSGALGHPGLGTGASWSDADLDGDADLYLVNIGPNVLFRNDDGAFVDVSAGGAGDSGVGLGASWGDFDDDGDPDVYISNIGPNTLLRNDGGLQFASIATAPLDDSGAGRGTSWVDTDLDGDLDLYLANSGGPNHLFRNDAGVFVDATSAPLAGSGNSQGVAWADADANGAPDAYIVDSSDNRLVLNFSGSSRHWLAVRLVGTASNRSAIGARVRVQAAGTSRFREINAASGYGSQSSLTQSFGLGAAEAAEAVEVFWPSGATTLLANVPADRTIEIIEGVTTAAAPAADLPTVYRLDAPVPNPFRSNTQIRYELPLPGLVDLSLFDVQGRLVRTLVKAQHPAGRHVATWDGRDSRGSRVASGVYFARIQARDWRRTARVLHLR